MQKRRLLSLLIFFTAFVVVAAGITYCQQKGVDISVLYKEIELFSDAISLINANYIEIIEPKKLIYGALKGMLSSLDGYSQFMDPDAFKEMKIDTKGKFGGLGIEIGIKEGMLTIISPIDGTPAAGAGLSPGDVIVKIDGEITKDIPIHEAVKKLRGKPGSNVTLSIWREKEGRFFDITITREIIEIKSIREIDILENDIGYIKLIEFQEKTGKELENVLKEFKDKNVKGLILDLRNNPGGLLEASVYVSDLLLKKDDIIVTTKGRDPGEINEFKSIRETPYTDITLAVLVNEGSASASEIVAGAIKDNRRGIVIGEKTFGKGSVQTVIPLKDGSALRITSAEYFTPGGYSIREMGIMPDIVVASQKTQKELKKEKKENIFKELEKEKEEKPEIVDNQIRTALDVIKAINLHRDGRK